ncbi:hypothetical protein M426DRAFT_9772 [Hypoxylon sp. CI-4A]|nr:hypothetical protein M426DRAFT_9772 [Hypoxylon sp. CI-4A]
MAETNVNINFEQLNSLFRSYLDQLDKEFGERFTDPTHQGRQYKDEFHDFVRREILLPSDQSRLPECSPPSEVITRFMEWKITMLEKENTFIKSELQRVKKTQPTMPTVSSQEPVAATKPASGSGNMGRKKPRSALDRSDYSSPRPNPRIKKRSPADILNSRKPYGIPRSPSPGSLSLTDLSYS